MCAQDLLPSDSSKRSRAVRRAGHAAGSSAYAEERGLGMPRRASACVGRVTMPAAASGAHAGGARDAAAPMRRPRLRHRRVVLAELVVFLCELARRFPAPIGVCGPSAWLVGGTAVPLLVRDALIGAADEQLRAGADGAVVRRMVQRCPPTGRGGHSCIGASSATADALNSATLLGKVCQRRDDVARVARSLPNATANNARDGATHIGFRKVSADDGLEQGIVRHSYSG